MFTDLCNQAVENHNVVWEYDMRHIPAKPIMGYLCMPIIVDRSNIRNLETILKLKTYRLFMYTAIVYNTNYVNKDDGYWLDGS